MTKHKSFHRHNPEIIEKVEALLKTSKEPLKASTIAVILNLKGVEGAGKNNPSYAVSNALLKLSRRGLLLKNGKGTATHYLWNPMPNKVATTKYISKAAKTLQPVGSLQKPILIELPRAVLKLLVKDVMQNNPNPTPEMQRALNCAVEKLL